MKIESKMNKFEKASKEINANSIFAELAFQFMSQPINRQDSKLQRRPPLEDNLVGLFEHKQNKLKKVIRV